MKSIKSVFIKAACMLALVSISNSFSKSQAQSVVYTVAGNETKGDIRFVKAQDGMLVFDLNLKNLPAKGSILQIKDEAGTVLFEESIKTENFNVRYKIERNNISKISFEVTAKRFLLNRTFTINSYTEEKIYVAKL